MEYSSKAFSTFRSVPLLDSAMNFVANGNTIAVQTVLDLHWTELSRNHLDILSGFPESINPQMYRSALPPLSSHIPTSLDKRTYKNWYENRARQIEAEGGMADNAVALLTIAKELGIDVDHRLYHLLTTEASLGLDCRKIMVCEFTITFQVGKTNQRFYSRPLMSSNT